MRRGVAVCDPVDALLPAAIANRSCDIRPALGVRLSDKASFGMHKAGVDMMAADMAVDFRESDVAARSIWMGSLATERLLAMIAAEPAKYGHLTDALEMPEFTGHITWALFNDPNLMALRGQTVIGAEMSKRYGVTDRDRLPPSVRDTHGIEPRVPYPHIIR